MTKFVFLTTPDFDREFKHLKKKYKSLTEDMLAFKKEFMANPKLGTDLGFKMRKVRLAVKSKGKGKSGGARIITFDLFVTIDEHTVLLVYLYDKSDIESVDVNDLKNIIKQNVF